MSQQTSFTKPQVLACRSAKFDRFREWQGWEVVDVDPLFRFYLAPKNKAQGTTQGLPYVVYVYEALALHDTPLVRTIPLTRGAGQ